MPKIIPKNKQKEIALQRINTLFQQAESTFSKNKSLADRYVQLARSISMKVKVKIPAKYKRHFCKYCHSFLMPGVNSRIRTRLGKVVISCLECKKFMRIPMKKIK